VKEGSILQKMMYCMQGFRNMWKEFEMWYGNSNDNVVKNVGA